MGQWAKRCELVRPERYLSICRVYGTETWWKEGYPKRLVTGDSFDGKYANEVLICIIYAKTKKTCFPGIRYRCMGTRLGGEGRILIGEGDH